MKRALYAAGPVGLALLVVGIGWLIVAPRVLPAASYASIALGAVLVCLSLWSTRSLALDRSSGKRVRQGAGFLVSALIGLLLFLLVNFIATRYNERWDLTRYRSFSLHPATMRVLETIDRDVEVFGFVPERDKGQTRNVRQLYELYEFNQPRVSSSVLDANKYPDLIRELGVGQNGMTVVRSGEKIHFFPGFEEAKLTAALLEVRYETPKVVYWVIGHGERTLDTAGGEGFLRLQGDLVRTFHQIRLLSLDPGEAVPEDASLVVFADPSEPLTPSDVKAYDEYLRSGGRVLILTEPGNGDAPHPASSLLSLWGLKVAPGVVVDARESKLEQYSDSQSIMAPGFTTHDSIVGLRGKNALLPGCGHLEFFQVMQDQQIFHYVLLRSARNTYVVPMPRGGERPASPDAEVVERWRDSAPILGLAAFRRWEGRAGTEDLGREARLVVFGDTDFVKDEFYDALANRELVGNVIRWLTGAEVLINRTGERLTAKQAMQIEPDERQMVRAFVVIQAAIVFLLGWIVWFVRRTR